MTIYIRIFVLIAVVAGMSTTTFALKKDKEEPAVIDADSTEFDFRTGTRTWIGNVKVRQGTMRITADKLVADYKDNVLQRAIAYGNPAVFIQRPSDQPDDVIGKGRRLEMDEVKQIVTFFENASLKQGANTVVGKKLIYDMETEKMRVTGRKGIGTKTNVNRAKISLDRSSKKKPKVKINNIELTEPTPTASPKTESPESNSLENSTDKSTSKSPTEEQALESQVEDSAAKNPAMEPPTETSDNPTRTSVETVPTNQQQSQ